MAETRPRKIAVIGATGYEYSSPEARVECFPWNRIRRIGNLADYDEVVIDLLDVEDAEELDGDALEEILNVRSTYEVLANGQEEGAKFNYARRKKAKEGS